MTGEHICSAWIGRLFDSEIYNWTHTHETGEIKRWKSKSLDETLPVVCDKCNNGWMSDIENLEAKPALTNMIRDGAAQSLLPRGIIALACFAFKNAVVANHANLNKEPFFTPAAREQFRKNLTIPPGVQMWVGAFHGIYAHSGICKSYYLEPQLYASDPQNFELYVFTFVAGHLAFQVLASKWKSLFSRGMPPPALRPDKYWDSAATSFWPMDGFPLSWPPEKYLSNDSIRVFSNRWADTPLHVK